MSALTDLQASVDALVPAVAVATQKVADLTSQLAAAHAVVPAATEADLTALKAKVDSAVAALTAV